MMNAECRVMNDKLGRSRRWNREAGGRSPPLRRVEDHMRVRWGARKAESRLSPTAPSPNVSVGIPKGKMEAIPDVENPIHFPLWPSGESGQAVCGALCAPRRQAARCPQTAAHAYAPLALPLAARSNAAIREVPGGSLDTFSPERKYHAPYALLLQRKTDSAFEQKHHTLPAGAEGELGRRMAR